MNTLRKLLLTLAIVLAPPLGAIASAADDTSAKIVQPFIENHCMDCHDASTARAGFRIDLLTDDFTAGNNAGQWKEVMDKINAGEMPPKKKARPDAKEAFAVASWVAQKLDETTKAAQGAGGRVPMRRMNRVEYANTVRDLFSLDENFARRVEKELPTDGKVGGFDRGASGLFMDDGQLDRYMAVADMVLNEAVFNEPPKVQTLTWDPAQTKFVHGINVAYKDASGKVMEDNPTPGFVATLAEPLSMIPIDSFGERNPKERRFVPHGVFPWTVKGDGIEYLSGGSNYRRPNLRSGFYAWDWGRQGVSADGWYRLRIKAGAFAGRGKEAQKEVRLVVEYCFGSPLEVVKSAVIDAPLDAPKEYEFLMYLQAGPPGFNRQLTMGWDNGDKNVVIVNPDYDPVQYKPGGIGQAIIRAKAEKKPAEEIEALKKQLEEAFATALENRKTFEGPYFVWDPKLDIADRPRIWLGQAEWEGPARRLAAGGPQVAALRGRRPRGPGGISARDLREVPAEGLPPRGDAAGAGSRGEVDPDDDGGPQTFARAGRARGGEKRALLAEVPLSRQRSDARAGHVRFVRRPAASGWLGTRQPPLVSALEHRAGRGALPPGRAGQAARTRRAARAGQADDRRPEGVGIRPQLRGPMAQRAQLRQRQSAEPRRSTKIYDDALRDSSKREPLEFCHEVLAHDLPITDFLESDFLVVNERLARHYGLEGVEGDDFRRVPAPADDRRGGILGMSGILTYLADGTRTLPVRRAAWVLDTLWNQPVPPPPPNAGDLPAHQGQEAPHRPRAPRRASPLRELRELPRAGRPLWHGPGKLRRHRHVARPPERRRDARRQKRSPDWT